MKSLNIVGRQAGFVAVVASLLIALVAPILVSAAQVTERSIALSSSSVDSTDVSYAVTFKSAVGADAAGAFVIDFCSNSPVIGEACTPPTDFDATAVATATSGYTIPEDEATANSVVIDKTVALAANSTATFTLTEITNPSVTGPMYARIVTYDTEASALLHDVTDTDEEDANRIDSGSVAIFINPTIGVSAAVLESMTFCVSGAEEDGDNPITANCTGTLLAPTLQLGEGEPKALEVGTISTGDIYTQISTNAASGVVVNLKSSATGCGGLINSSKAGCYILPALNTDILDTGVDSKFGLKIAAADFSGAAGTLQAASGALYNGTTYALNYVSGDATGITSIYGDPILDTGNTYASNKGMKLTFGATINNSTPAGKYSADLSLIATGKF